MEYYLTEMKCKINQLVGEIDVIQLVKATIPEFARKIVKETAEKEHRNIVIFSIRIKDTLIGL